jgi:hypothetical protein
LGVGGAGMKHLVWQLATCELQFIMQVVVVKVREFAVQHWD